MSKHPYRIVVSVSDKYLPALRPFAWLMNKYWHPNPQVVVAGFTPPDFDLPGNFEFRSIGEFSDYPIDKWTNALTKFLTDFEDEVFILMLEDYWLTRPVDTGAVQILIDYMHQFEYVIKMDLCSDRLYAYGVDMDYGHAGRIDLIKSMPGSPYHMSLYTGAWRKSHLLRHLSPGWTPWDVEIIGTTRLSHDQDVIVLGSKQQPIKHTLAFRASAPGELLLNEIDKSDVYEMRALGLLAPWEKQ